MRTVAALCRELTTDHRHDGELLAAFVSGPSEEAFTELVRRHGPLVWGACRRLLPDPADAEDAFQAAFLVLIRRARRLTRVSSLGPWMHRVAVWTARNVRRKNARRLARQTAMPDHVTDPTALTDSDLKVDIDAALLALPSRYRDPIVLCHLLGFSRREAAERLGCPEGTLSAWLSRGLVKLRKRLRTLDPTNALTVATVSVPVALSASTARTAVAAVAAGSVPPAVSSLVEGVLHMLWMKKATAAAVALFATFALGVGVGLSTRTERTGAGAQDNVPTGTQPKAAAQIDLERDFAKLQAQLDAASARHHAAVKSAEAASDEATIKRFQKEADDAAVEANALKAKLDQLKERIQKAAQKPPAGPVPDAIADINRQLARLQDDLAASRLKRKKLIQQVADIEQEAKALDLYVVKVEEMTRQLQAKRNELAPEKAIKPGAHLELTVLAPQVPQGEFALKEFDAAGKVVGTVVTREPQMLTKLLVRTRADATAPKELRVVVQPTAVMTGWTTSALQACEKAGFAKVKFTGYVFGGGFATPLKPDQKGEIGGYKHYEAAEMKPADLIKEIEDGMRRF
jgi:RNA polymerase sigma factor (sigma-70 family)